MVKGTVEEKEQVKSRMVGWTAPRTSARLAVTPTNVLKPPDWTIKTPGCLHRARGRFSGPGSLGGKIVDHLYFNTN